MLNQPPINDDGKEGTVAVNPEVWLNAVRKAWQSEGLRITEPRMRLLRSIVEYETPFSAEQLYADIALGEQRPGRATVYRTLEQLQSAGWLARIHSQNNEAGYVPSFPGHLHHIICTVCGAVVAFEGCALEGLLERLAEQTHFAIDGHLLQLYGRCAGYQVRSEMR